MSLFHRVLKRTTLLVVIASMLVFMTGAAAFAAPQTLVILGASGSPGQVDPYTEYSLDGGQTWSQAYLYGWHPWGFVPGTNSWINCGPSGFVCLNQTVLYRVRFNVPSGFSNVQMQFDVKADNAATIWLNGTYVTYIVGSGGTTADATIASALTAGLNEITLKVDDWGGWAGFNYKVTLNMDAPAPPSLVPGGEVPDTVPPVLTVPGPLTVECKGTNGVSAGDPALQAWVQQAAAVDEVDGPVAVTNDLSGDCNLGTTTVTFTATDAAGNTATASSQILVVDTTAPVINAISVTPEQIWAPNHKMVNATVSVDASDLCSAGAACQIVSVTSNEPANGKGDGNTEVDWQITGALTVDLRAERSGQGTGRVYTITVACADDSGNVSSRTVTVSVPHSQKK